MFNALMASSMIIVLPIMGAAIIFIFYSMSQKKRRDNTVLWLILASTMAITLAYIFIPDPAVITSLYTSKGDYTTPILFSVVGASFLLVYLFLLKKSGRRSNL